MNLSAFPVALQTPSPAVQVNEYSAGFTTLSSSSSTKPSQLLSTPSHNSSTSAPGLMASLLSSQSLSKNKVSE